MQIHERWGNNMAKFQKKLKQNFWAILDSFWTFFITEIPSNCGLRVLSKSSATTTTVSATMVSATHHWRSVQAVDVQLSRTSTLRILGPSSKQHCVSGSWVPHPSSGRSTLLDIYPPDPGSQQEPSSTLSLIKPLSFKVNTGWILLESGSL